jgi:hypothetical protein
VLHYIQNMYEIVVGRVCVLQLYPYANGEGVEQCPTSCTAACSADLWYSVYTSPLIFFVVALPVYLPMHVCMHSNQATSALQMIEDCFLCLLVLFGQDGKGLLESLR